MSLIIQSEQELRKKSEKVDLLEGMRIATRLKEELEKSDIGIGLSAPQIGIFKRVFVAQIGFEVKTFINPTILKLEHPVLFKGEGCLSFPGIEIDTIRHRKVTIVDENNGEMTLEDTPAVLIQHETDHLDGKLMFDYKVPDLYGLCICKSKKKFKFCCRSYLT